MLDAQASLLDDYLKWMPQDETRIKKFVKEKINHWAFGIRKPIKW